jgi:transposase InsO family protein
MNYNGEDKTLERNYKQKWRHLVLEYELIKEKKHTRYRFVGEFFKAHGISRQLFNKIYRRYACSGKEEDLLPHKRGPKWQSRRPDVELEHEVIEARKKGLNRYEICDIIRRKRGEKAISASGVYNIIKREGMNVLRVEEREAKRIIIKERAGELGHIDAHYITQGLVKNKKQCYIVCIVDSYSRIAWAEAIEDLKSITVMFAVLRLFNAMKVNYGILFEQVLTDNGPEFASRNNTIQHPFERMLIETGVKHKYTRPYRPQTNGKVERFWRTLKEDLLECDGFDSMEHLQDELIKYVIYYNEIRPHQSLGGKTPLSTIQFLSTN